MQRMIPDYAAAGWQPWLSPTVFGKLEVAQNTCPRAITGQYQNTDTEILRLEAGVPSYRTHSNRLIATAYEKGRRLPEDHPRRVAIQNQARHRTERLSFREVAKEIINKTTLANTTPEPITISFQDCSTDATPNWSIITNEDIKGNIEQIGARIEALESELTIYTDGSCSGGVKDGGAAAVVTNGPFSQPNCIEVIKEKGSVHTCSYLEERRAMLLGLNWLTTHPGHGKVAFCTDSLSLLQAIQNNNPDTAEIRNTLQRACEEAVLVFVPGHKDIPGNELADQHAKSAAAMSGKGNDDAVPMRAARTIIRNEVNDGQIEHRIAKKFYASVRQDRDDTEVLSRKKAVLLAQVRSGHHKGFAYYDAIINPHESSECRYCETGEVDDVEHWLTRCEQSAAARQEIFGTTDVDMVELAVSPARIIKLAERTLVGRAAMQG